MMLEQDHNGVWLASDPNERTCLEKLYFEVRAKEGRVYNDKQVRELPDVPRDHVHHDEWRIRARSLNRLQQYLNKKDEGLILLDLGCGNGWMSRHLANNPSAEKVLAVDMNYRELKQAARLFSEVDSMQFIYGDIFEPILEEESIDVIVLASVIQYFQNLNNIIDRLLVLLKPSGEIHILDSPFYQFDQRASAQKRTEFYYHSLGVPKMAAFYHHHLFSDLEPYNPHYLYKPHTLTNRFRRRLFPVSLSPFPWLRIVQMP